MIMSRVGLGEFNGISRGNGDAIERGEWSNKRVIKQ